MKKIKEWLANLRWWWKTEFGNYVWMFDAFLLFSVAYMMYVMLQ